MRGMATISPRMPPSAVPQKKTATMIAMKCSPVRSPMIFGVRNQPSICCTTRTTASTSRHVSHPPSAWKKAMGMATARPIMFPRKGMTLSIPRARPMTNP